MNPNKSKCPVMCEKKRGGGGRPQIVPLWGFLELADAYEGREGEKGKGGCMIRPPIHLSQNDFQCQPCCGPEKKKKRPNSNLRKVKRAASTEEIECQNFCLLPMVGGKKTSSQAARKRGGGGKGGRKRRFLVIAPPGDISLSPCEIRSRGEREKKGKKSEFSSKV